MTSLDHKGQCHGIKCLGPIISKTAEETRSVMTSRDLNFKVIQIYLDGIRDNERYRDNIGQTQCCLNIVLLDLFRKQYSKIVSFQSV